tara:strand:+ start:4407 stop:5060 length:654 start_codon:yes stop_codon:yes gene_type:complete
MLNSNMSIAAVVYAGTMDWQTSPSATVSRKRFHLVGEAETGQVTSLVQYNPGASFPAHAHPGGEEILVLKGIFSDETGDWPIGSYLLNPEGFTHAPYSKAGCRLLVKLRQYPDLQPVRLALDSLKTAEIDGVNAKMLHSNAIEKTIVAQLDEGQVITRKCEGGCEGFVLAGNVKVNGANLGQYDWFRFPDGDSIRIISQDCSLYLKFGAVIQLSSHP